MAESSIRSSTPSIYTLHKELARLPLLGGRGDEVTISISTFFDTRHCPVALKPLVHHKSIQVLVQRFPKSVELLNTARGSASKAFLAANNIINMDQACGDVQRPQWLRDAEPHRPML
ncbi:hypothetical protein [Bradyrhizobium archetypum]|uniref:Uncharacterized protein n=1 Tax=Bradyrhizobium archetypum TaxID=2721160 RepID=A0A7Y4HAY2_9BRAD|nr:hypothetical protein [Bradyrhizobium archetypum]NOJ50874.1 hypothetical protein [Bradyrhizobium archetypum]